MRAALWLLQLIFLTKVLNYVLCFWVVQNFTRGTRRIKYQNTYCYIVTDNASNMTAAVRLCEWRHVQCFAHSLNLVAQAGVAQIQAIVNKIKAIVVYFKRSSQALNKLHIMQDQLGVPCRKLVQDVLTRWNSTYDMMDRFVVIKDALVSTLAILDTNLEQLTSHEWKVVGQAKNVLEKK